MPGYKGHLMGGIAVYGILFFIISTLVRPSTIVAFEWCIFTLAGALFPDIDVKSKGQKYFYFVVLLFFVVLLMHQRFEMLSCCSCIVISPMLVRHRGIFHSPRFIVITPLIGWILMSMVFPDLSQQLFFDTLFFIIGALSHLWLDFGPSQMIRRLFANSRSRY